ncbi:MAG: hypothetical protein ACRDHY_08705, partial [Anaerolineales bacterium]
FPAPPALVWWVVPSRLFAESVAEDRPGMFEGARDKLYRDQAFYHTDTLMRQIRHAKGEVEEEAGE